MPRSDKKRKKKINYDNVFVVKEEVSKFLKKASDDCPVPSKKQREEQPAQDHATLVGKISKEQSKLWKQRAMQYPKLFLDNAYRGKKDAKKCGKSLSIDDIQSLAMHGLVGQHDTTPQWCKLLRAGKVSKVVVLVLNGVSNECYRKNKECFPHIRENFSVSGKVEMKNYQCFVDDFVYREMSVTKYKNLTFGVTKQADIISSNGNTDGNQPEEETEKSTDKPVASDHVAGRTCYLLTEQQRVRQNFPKAEWQNIKSTNYSAEVTNSSPMIGLDCEMCTTAKGSELTRVSLVSEDGKAIYDSLVKPDNPIIDYVTRYSGITKKLLDPVTTKLQDVQKDIVALLPKDAIIVGQSVANDFRALKMYHPHIIDSSCLFTRFPVALRKLTKFYLGRVIQNSQKGHSSVEDAVASLDLVKLKVEKGHTLKPFACRGGHRFAPHESIFQRIGSDVVSMMIDSDSVLRRLYKDPVGCIPTSNDTETRKKAVKAIDSFKFLWAQFHSYRTYLEGTTRDEDEQKLLLTKLDGRVRKIYNALPEKSLVITVMVESTKGEVKSKDDKNGTVGRFFAGIKMSAMLDLGP